MPRSKKAPQIYENQGVVKSERINDANIQSRYFCLDKTLDRTLGSSEIVKRHLEQAENEIERCGYSKHQTKEQLMRGLTEYVKGNGGHHEFLCIYRRIDKDWFCNFPKVKDKRAREKYLVDVGKAITSERLFINSLDGRQQSNNVQRTTLLNNWHRGRVTEVAQMSSGHHHSRVSTNKGDHPSSNLPDVCER